VDQRTAAADLAFVSEIVKRSHARIDTHAFHSISWGVIVLVWYPLANWLGARGAMGWYAAVCIAGVVLGTVASVVLERRLASRPRLPGENTFIASQVIRIVYGNIAAGVALSIVGPATWFVPGPYVPIIWGLVYANMAFMTGVVYTREYLVAGVVIFLGSLAAIAFKDQAGYILGPFMGVGMIVPGVMGERRVARLRAADDAADV